MKKFKLKFNVVIPILVLAFLGVFSFTIFYFFFMPTIELKNNSVITINYNSKYEESGYIVKYRNKKINKKVKISGIVNSKKLGVYNISYSIKSGFFTKKVIRKVKVRDIEKPIINLENNNKVIYVCPNTTYEIGKYTVSDNYDKNLLDRLKITKTDDQITYAVTDSSGNYDIVKQKIVYADRTSPEITLNSSEILFTYMGEEFKDPGFSAKDNCDGNITDNVKTLGVVDTSKLGTYELSYEVSDKEGNKDTKTRKVNVIKRGQNGTIYLTFDDGPKDGTTNVILDILKEEGIKATFFVTNKGPDELIVREYAEGHTVGLHTASHNYALIYSSIENYFNDLNIVHDRVFSLTGYDSKILRFPGGSSNTISRKYKQGIMSELTRTVLEKGYKYYDWNILSGDAGETTEASGVYNMVTSKLSHDKVNIVLMHDIKTYTRDALKSIIKYGKDNGYTFEAITNDTEMMSQKVNN